MAQRGEVSCPRSHSQCALAPEPRLCSLGCQPGSDIPPTPSTGPFSNRARMGTFKEGGFAGWSPPAAGRRPRSQNTGARGGPRALPRRTGLGSASLAPPLGGTRGRRRRLSPPRLPPPPWRLPRRAGVQFQRADERSLRPASRGRKEASGGCTVPSRARGSAVEGPRLWAPGPGARRASGREGDAREPRRAGPGGRRAPCPTDVPAALGRAGAGWGWPPALRLHGGVAEQLFVPPGAACKCVCARAGACSPVPRSPSPSARSPVPAQDLGSRGRRLGCWGGDFHEVGGNRTGWSLPAPQPPGPRQRPKVGAAGAASPPPSSSPASTGLGRREL